TSASYAIATNVVSVPRPVTLTASYGGVLQRTTVIVAPENAVTLASFTVTPSRVIGGTPANGTIVLTGPAPFGGAVVTVIAKRRTMITVPASVLIPEGATSATFPIATGLVHGNKERLAEIGATYNGITRTATLALAPPLAASATRPVARCASLALEPCLTREGLRAAMQAITVTESRYAFYTPELQLLSETADSTAAAKPIAFDYVWFGGEPVAQIETATGEVSFYFNDHLGTPVLTAGASANVAWRVEREPYGNVVAFRAGADKHQPLAFPGQEEGEGDIAYNVFRWYRSPWGRYTQADPLTLGPDDPNPSFDFSMPLDRTLEGFRELSDASADQFEMPFVYAAANPARHKDVTGRSILPPGRVNFKCWYYMFKCARDGTKCTDDLTCKLKAMTEEEQYAAFDSVGVSSESAYRKVMCFDRLPSCRKMWNACRKPRRVR
ncbi:MAG: RHS repeat domain-containing protein, partial [Thermoanaerobaculia bacterium]